MRTNESIFLLKLILSHLYIGENSVTDKKNKKLELEKSVEPKGNTEARSTTKNSPLKLKSISNKTTLVQSSTSSRKLSSSQKVERLSSVITNLSKPVDSETGGDSTASVTKLQTKVLPKSTSETNGSIKLSKKLLKSTPEVGSQTGNATRLTKRLLKPTTQQASTVLLKTGSKTKTLLRKSKVLTRSDEMGTRKTLKLSRKLTSNLSLTNCSTGTTGKVLLPHTQKGDFAVGKNPEVIDPNAKKILIVDDEVSILKVLSHIFKKHGYYADTANTVQKATALLESQQFDLVITDIKLANDGNGLEILNLVKKMYPNIPVVIITGYATIKLTIEALKQNAFDLVTKPFKMDQLLEVIENALSHEQSIDIDKLLNQDMKLHFGTIVGEDEKMKKIYSVIKRVAKTDATILIEGESGTGKPLFAKIVHYCSKRAESPFITISGNLLSQDHISAGLIDKMAIKANGGTLFIQDIHLINKKIQDSLLKILTTKKALSSSGEEIQVNIRLFVSSVKSLKEMQKKGEFSKELYFRMCAFSLNIPALREHIDDIPLIWNYLSAQNAEETNSQETIITKDALVSIINYPWPENVREMKSVLEEAIQNSDKVTISNHDLPDKIRESRNLSNSKTKMNHVGKVARQFLQQQVNNKMNNKNTSLRIKR